MRAQARRREVRDGMERQFRESMAAPEWELEDYDWCVSRACTPARMSPVPGALFVACYFAWRTAERCPFCAELGGMDNGLAGPSRNTQ